jgi:Tfp pilus assembly protein PilX
MRLAHQRGTTLIVGLLLLTVVMLLGLAGADSANIERQLARNEQFRENAASAASAGIEYAISRIVSSPPPDSDIAPLQRGGIPCPARRHVSRPSRVSWDSKPPCPRPAG